MITRETNISITIGIMDVLSALGAVYASAAISSSLVHQSLFASWGHNIYPHAYVFIPLLIAIFILSKLYDLKRFEMNRRNVLALFMATCLAGFCALAITSAFSYHGSALAHLLGASLILPVFAAGSRASALKWVRHRSRNKTKRLALIGDRRWVALIEDAIGQKKNCEYEIVAICSTEPHGTGQHDAELSGNTYRYYVSIGALLDAEEIDALALDTECELLYSENVSQWIDQLVYRDFELVAPNKLYQSLTKRYPTASIHAEALAAALSCGGDRNELWYLRSKRAFDIVFSALMLVLISIPMVLIAIIIKLDSPGPAFFVQVRLGYRRRPFGCIKFRTMINDAEGATGPVWASTGDPRLTRSGGILRRLRLDELPQLFNVLKGEMSLVGPRPIRAHFADLLAQKQSYYNLRFLVAPGLTGWAQIRQGYAASVDDQETKFGYDLFYMEHRSFYSICP